METKRNEKCGWGCFFRGPWRVCKWSETLGVASGWAWVWIRTLHLGHMCRQQGQKDGDAEPKPEPKPLSLWLFFLCLNLKNLMSVLTMPQVCTFSNFTMLPLNSFCGNEYNKDTYNVMCLWSNAVDTLNWKMISAKLFSVVKYVWWRRGDTNKQQIHNTTKDKKRTTIGER